jgi:hypothetical protein
MNRIAVTPTFQSARLAGWKTGATKLNGFMAPMRVRSWRLKLSMNLKTPRLQINNLGALRFMVSMRAQSE